MRGIFTATVTPFTKALEVDMGAVEGLTQFQEARGVAGVVPCGTNGEFPSLTIGECKAVIRAVDGARDRMKLIAGTGRSSIKETLELTKYAAEYADAVLVCPPFYFKDLSLGGLYDYYAQIMEAANIPVILYHIPKYTGVPITHELLERLGGFDNLLGVKDSSGDINVAKGYRERFPDLALYMGSDALVFEGLALGSAGAISAISNFAPGLLVEIYGAFVNGALADAEKARERLLGLRGLVKRYPSIGAIKHALALMGVIEGDHVRPPLGNLSPEEKEELERGLRAGGWL
ncbi:MAG: 4-hydroxy-tetrahydrodipicolinate synthase [Euryarchaeota archaeon]|nr:4-hydroxy-tetrahydrodipicolinate synthase [Euryarchaeota archaeon]